MERAEIWKDFFGDDFFRTGKNGTFHRVSRVEDLRDTDIDDISVRLSKFWELHTNPNLFNKLKIDEGLPKSVDIEDSHFGYTCAILKDNCTLLKKIPYDGKANEIKRYLENLDYQKFVDILLDKLISQAQHMNPRAADPISSEEKEEDEKDRAAEQVEFLGIINGLEDTKRTAVQRAFKATQSASIAQKAADGAQEAADSAKKTAEGILPNILTTLGIFVAIIVAVVACYLSLLLSQHYENAHPLNITICLLMGHILTNIICLLLYLISKMTSLTLSCNCPIGDKKDCGLCSPEKQRACTWVNKIWLKYPYVVLLNGIFCLAYVGLGLWSIGRKYLGKKIDEVLIEDPLLVFALLLAIVLTLSIFIRAMIGRFRWKEHKANTTMAQKIHLIFSGTIGFFFRCAKGILRCLTAPFHRAWIDLVRIAEKSIDARRENDELKREFKELERRIGELERNAQTEAGRD